MKTLLFRIFISFWLAMALIIVCAIGVTATVAWRRITMLNSVDLGELVDHATAALADQGLPGLQKWLRVAAQGHPSLDIYVVDTSGQDVLGRPLPDRIAKWLVFDRRPGSGTEGSTNEHYWPYGYDWAPGGVTISHGLGFNGSHLLANPKIVSPDGRTFTLLVAWFGATPIDVLGSPSIALMLFAFALGASAIISWSLAHYISHPVIGLQAMVRTLALGNLSTPQDQEFSKRRDELGTLAKDINQMAARIRSQVASKETLLRDISHELRSPLARIRVALALAQRKNADVAIHLGRIERDADRLDALIGQILQLSRLSEADPEFPRETIELDVLLNEIAEEARIEASTAGRVITLSTVPGLAVQGSRELIHRALDNVLRNALRFAPPESAVLVSARTDENGTSILVRDHGPGIPEPELERVFEAFYRVTEARDRDNGGTGLGLAITARIMALHGGRAVARNEPDGGLVVELRFPTVCAWVSVPLENAARHPPRSTRQSLTFGRSTG